MTRRSGWTAALLAVAALVVVWRLIPGSSPPLYDGQCLVSPYAGLGGSPSPASALKTFSPTAPSPFAAAEVITGESPPQAQILMEEGTFTATATTITIGVAPVPAPAARPSDGGIDGNVYRFSAEDTAGAALEPAPGLPVTIILRATTSTPSLNVERLDGARWTRLQTFNAGCGNTYEAVSDRLGDFAVVIPRRGGGGGTATPGGGIPAGAAAAALVVVLIIAVVALLRLDRGRRR